MPRYLTKSRFKLAVECPTKLYYTGKKEYANLKNENDFLKALADGGFQVGELAKLMYPGGKEIEFNGNFEAAINETRALLQNENIIIYEAAIQFDNYFVLVDILVKKGNSIELIEVKAKSFNSEEDEKFRNSRGNISTDMLPYLQDIAFQTFVAKKAYPQFEYSSALMLSDKSKKCSVYNLNQNFKILKDENQRTKIEVNPGLKPEDLGDPVLTAENVDIYVKEILETALTAPGFDGRFEDLIKRWSEAYEKDQKIKPNIRNGTHCKNCEFKKSTTEPDLKSGFLECWQEITHRSIEDIEKGTVADIYDFKSKAALIEKGKYLFDDIEREDLDAEELKGEIKTNQRQWMQISGEIPGGGDFYFYKELAQKEMDQWDYPLHFIDFETSRTAIPFFKGQRPYANVAFQFSHHMVYEDQRVEHHSQFLETRSGIHPNYAFVRALMASLGDKGTIFMWTPHENTTLNSIYYELLEDEHPPTDAEDLKQFILDVTVEKKNKKIVRQGSRVMYDLCALSKKVYFHKDTDGSSSIKKVLPSVLKSSNFLKEKYAQPLLKTKGESLNFEHMIWWTTENNEVINPYKLLPPVFSDIHQEAIETLESDPDLHISEGGSATVAYGRLQFSSVPPEEREALHASLLRYCELDTLAMIMVYEAFREWSQ
jgi:hypothetical protein